MKPEEFVSTVVSKYQAGTGVFKNKLNAEELIPSDLDDLSSSQYIFYVLQLDYAMKSQILYNGARKLHSLKHDFFTPQFIEKLAEEDLSTCLKKYLRPRYINEAVKRYSLNTRKLVEIYRGDPRKIFEGVNKCTEVEKRLKEFRGFGPKIGNFFIRTMINTFYYAYDDIDTILPPVDIHDVRIAYLLGYIDSDQMTENNINRVKKVWSDACLNSGNSWLIFDKALWLLGSEGKPKSKVDILRLINE
jgi:hypothetical protein